LEVNIAGEARDHVALAVLERDLHRVHGRAGSGRRGVLGELEVVGGDRKGDAEIRRTLRVPAVGLPRGVTLHPRLPVVTRIVLQPAHLNEGGITAWRRSACGVRLAPEVGADGPYLNLDAGGGDGGIAHQGAYDEGRLRRGPAGGDRRGHIAAQLRDRCEATPTAAAAAATPTPSPTPAAAATARWT